MTAPDARPAPSSPAPGWSAPAWSARPPTNTKAILAVALLSIPPAAIVFAVLARGEIRRSGEGGWGLATAGLWIAIGYLALSVLGVIAYLAFVLLVVLTRLVPSYAFGP